MMSYAWKSKLVGLLTLGLLTACGGSVQGPGYDGEPLATFKGHLTAQGQVGQGGGVRMALAWYSQLADEGVGAPTGIVTQDVVYTGSFPLNYTFNVTQPPPVDALTDLSEGGGPKKGAVGFLLAYEDVNGNGKLDTIPVAGQPVDKVLGASLDIMKPEGFAIVYVEEKSQGGDALEQSLDLGFNLIEAVASSDPNDPDGAGAKKVPLATSIPIALTGESFLNFFVCEEAWRADPNADPSGIPCGIDYEYPNEGEQGVFVGGTVQLDDNGAYVNVDVMKDGAFVPGTTVSFDGTAVPGNGTGNFELLDMSGALLSPGAVHSVTISVPGQPVIVESVQMPGAFNITSPGNDAVLPVGQTFSAAWTAAAHADLYMVSFAGDGSSGFHFSAQTTTNYQSDEVIAEADSATFTVSASTQPTAARRISAGYAKTIRVHFE